MYDGILLGPGSLAKAITYPYSTNTLWKKNDYCTYDGRIYKFIGTDLVAGESWTPAHWQEVKLTDEMGSGVGNGISFGVCNTAADITAKTVTIEGVEELYDGLMIAVRFNYGQTASNTLTLNVNSLGAYNIYITAPTDGPNTIPTAAGPGEWSAGEVLILQFINFTSETNPSASKICWIIVEHGRASINNYGLVRLTSLVNSNSESGYAATPKAVKTAYDAARTNFIGATSSANGSKGCVPAPSIGDQIKVLTGGGTWEDSPGSKLIEVTLDTVTNVSGSYSHTTEDDRITAEMKCIIIEAGTPTVFNAPVTITPGAGTVTLSCDNVVGTSTVKCTFQKVYSADPQTINSTEFTILANRITAIENVCTNHNITIHPSDWSASSPYTYEWSSSLIAENSSVVVTPRDGAENAGIRDFEAVKSTGMVTFTTDDLPTGDLPVEIKIINARPSSVQSLNAEDVSSEAITGADNVEEALTILNGEIGTLNSNINNILKIKTDTITGTYSNIPVNYNLQNAYSKSIQWDNYANKTIIGFSVSTLYPDWTSTSLYYTENTGVFTLGIRNYFTSTLNVSYKIYILYIDN